MQLPLTLRRRLLITLPVLILCVGAFLRLYRLDLTMQFFGDQGRDALIARAILMDRDPAFIGPQTSIGNMYLGPFYYYFMVLPLLITYPLPTGPAYAVALLGILTLWLIYVVGKEMFGKGIAIIAMALYAVSPIVISNVRFSWNPNLVPLAAILMVWLLWKALDHRDWSWVGIGILSAVLFQLHYIALTLIGAAGLIWLFILGTQLHHRRLRKEFVIASVLAVLLFLISLLPLLIFDLRHDFLNSRGFLSFFQATEGSGNFRSLSDLSAIFYAIIALAMRLLFEFFGIIIPRSEVVLSTILLLYLSVKMVVLCRSEVDGRRRQALVLICFLSLVTLIVLSLYKSSVYDHYLGFFFPIGIFLCAIIIHALVRSIFLRPLAIGLLSIYIVSSLTHYPGNQKLGANVYAFSQSSAEIAALIPASARYNLLVYTPTRDHHGMNYRYFLTTLGRPPAVTDDWTTIDTLVILDEEKRESPIDESHYAIANWPNRTIRSQHTLSSGARVSILTR